MSLQHLKFDNTWTLFLDRDGVINRRIVGDYVKTWDQFEFLPGVPGAMAIFARVFRRIIIVSNQQGVGKGLMTDHDVKAIHQKMVEEIRQAGGKVDEVFYSPHLHNHRSVMRKPEVGMALKARKHFPEIRFKRSVMAGDSLSDMVFGKRAGMKTVLISPDATLAKSYPRQIDFLYPDLISFANML
jgi:histidinol-phosphate phosphatase family protein